MRYVQARVKLRYSRSTSSEHAMTIVGFRIFKALNEMYGSAKIEIVSVFFCIQNMGPMLGTIEMNEDER